MRSLLLIVAAVVIAAVGFMAYVWWQDPGRGVSTTTQEQLTPSATQEAHGGVAGVQGIHNMVVRMLGKDGETTAIFRAKEYVPREVRGEAEVIAPQYEIFLKNGRRLVLLGEKGLVNLEERKGRNSSGLGGNTTAAPTRGQLYGVTIHVFEPDMTRPSMTMQTNNASFDNQTFKIVTEKYTNDAGKDVPADQVAVTIRGDDVDFDGRGLTLRYDDLNQQIALLQIAHGDQIVVKNPKVITGAKTARPKEKAALVQSAPEPQHTPITTTKPSAPVAVTPQTTQPAQAPYRVTLRDNVRIIQGTAPMAEADIITIDFRPEGDNKKSAAAATTRQATTAPATTTDATTGPSTAPAEIATTTPATQPAEPPIVIRWTGPLQMVALRDKPPIMPLAPGDAAMTASGSPLVLYQPQGTVVCASMIYRSADSSVSFYNGESAPRVTFADAKGDTRLTSLQVDYNDATKTAILLGASNLHMKLPASRPTTQPQELAANWNDRCVVKLDDSGSAKQIDLSGKVNINHPQMKLKSDALSLGLEPDPKDKTKATLKTATATGNVDADLSDAANAGRKVTSQKLVVTMDKGPDGQMFARQVDAEGSVNAVDSEQSLQAERVQLVMKPKATTQPASTQPADQMAAVDLESFLAEGAVVLKGKDSTGNADRIAVSTKDGQQVIELTGKPATLTQQGRTLTGPSILARPDDGYALVDGAGSMKTEGSATTRPADMTWAGRAELDAAKNTVTIKDQIKIRTTEADGTVINASSDQCIVGLRDNPTTKPAASNGEALRNKSIASATLAGKVVIDSELVVDGKVVKNSNLRAEKLTVGFDEQQQFASVDIPGPGQALHVDRSDPKPGEKQAVGAIAIEWKKSFRMDQKPDPVATFTGNVVMARLEKPDAQQSEVMRLEASRVRVTFEPTSATTRPTTRVAATKPAAGRPIVAGVRQVDASAPVVFQQQKARITAQSLLFTPSNNMVVLLGNEFQPVTWENDNVSQGTFTELWYDIEKQEPKLKRATIRGRQSAP